MSKNTKSQKAFADAREIFPGGVNSPVRSWRSVGGEPFIVERGEGPFLFDLDGNRYVDYLCSWGPLVLGHAPAVVQEAVQQQLAKGWSYGAPAEPERILGLEMQRHVPGLEMMRFVSSGTEATSHVIRVARGFTGRDKILKFDGCYHGAVDPLLAKAGSGVATLGLPDCAGVLASIAANTITAPYNDLDAVESIFRSHPEDIAIVILEPVIGNSGFIMPRPGFLEGLREISSRYGALLCFDEVMTGFRVSLRSAQGYFGVTPDLMTFGKVIGGGFPVGLYGGRRDVMSVVAPLGPVYQAGTLSGNPAGMVAGLATIREWTKDGVFDRAQRATTRLVQGLRERAKRCGIPFVAESLGTMFGFFFQDGPVYSYQDAKRSDLVRFKRFFHLMLERGVYLAPSQFEAGFISAVHTDDVIDLTLDAASEAFSELSTRLE
jgi:glutamate-1-semialdehyde 2,1-aminomutase